MTKVINLCGGPGAGKSTTAAGLFNLMKLSGEKVEYVTEYAKDLTYERNVSRLGNQMTVIGEQYNRLHTLVGQVDYIVTDSPLFLSIMYAQGQFKAAGFTGAILWAFEQFDNVNFLLERTKAYERYGRNQTEAEARAIDRRVESLMVGLDIPYMAIDGDANAPHEIYAEIKGEGGDDDMSGVLRTIGPRDFWP